MEVEVMEVVEVVEGVEVKVVVRNSSAYSQASSEM